MMRPNSLSRTKLYPNTAAGTSRRAVALVLTLVVLVVLTTIVYALASRVAQARHRRQYLIDYQMSRYACDSGVKYALTAIKEMDFKLINRKDKPDFSDVFTMGREEYELYLDEWALKLAEQDSFNGGDGSSFDTPSTGDVFDWSDGFGADSNSISDPNFLTADYTEPNAVFIPGPYGPEWPNVCNPIKFDIGETNVTIKITDENAKMPLTWLVAENDQVRKRALDAFDMFGSWMQMDPLEIQMLSEQLEDIKDIKRFTINPKSTPIKKTIKTTARSNAGRRRTISRRPSQKKPARPAISHTIDFAKLLHGPAIDFEILKRTLPDMGDRDESPLKYLATWGSYKVNINSAPRHVLEAAFTFGGDAEDIAEEIIRRRHEKPFKDIKDLEKSLYRYSESIRKVKAANYITTSSEFFTITVTAAHGRAKTSVVAMVKKEAETFLPVAIISQL